MGNSVIGALRVTLGLDTAAFEEGLGIAQKQLNVAGKKLQATGKTISGIGVGLSAAITAAFTALVATAIPAATESQQALAQVEAALKSMGPVAGRTSEQLQDAAAGLQSISVFDDDDILKSVTANLLTFGKVSGEVFDRAQLAAVNLSARLGQDLQSSAIQVGKALNDPVKGVTALQRVGVSFTAAQRDQIKAMTEAGDAAGAQKIILGELEKQFGGAAKAQRDATPGQDTVDAWREFQETIGAIALKVLPPLTSAMTAALNLFNNLSPTMQTVVVAGAAIAAALGPVLIGIGGLVSLAGTVLPAFAPLVAIVGEAGLAGALGALATAAAPVVAVGAAIVGAWVLFGDKVGPVLSAFAEKAQEVLGPKLMALFEAVKGALTALWEGPFGAMIRLVIDILGDFLATCTSIFGETLIRVLSAFVDYVSGVFTVIGDAIKVIGALLRGDFAGAWTALKQLVVNAVSTWLTVFNDLVPGITDAMKRLYEGVKGWILDKLNAVWDWVIEKVGTVKQAFADLYKSVVGNSDIPDMVTEVGEWIARLQGNMVDPVQDATAQAAEGFANMAQSAIGSVESIISSFKRGDLLGALDGVIGIVGQVGGLFGGGGGDLGEKIGPSILGTGSIFESIAKVALPGFAHGGSFKVGGVGGIDRNIVSFRATRGEMVNISNDDSPMRRGEGIIVNQTLHVAGGVDFATRSELPRWAQAAKDGALQAISEGRRRSG